jgi:hypothetical protein
VQSPEWEEFELEIQARALKDKAFRAELLRDPKATLDRELTARGSEARLPDELKVEIIEERADTLYLMLPEEDLGMGMELEDEALEAVAGGGTGSNPITWPDCSCCANNNLKAGAKGNNNKMNFGGTFKPGRPGMKGGGGLGGPK